MSTYYREDTFNWSCDLCGEHIGEDYITCTDGTICWDCAEERGVAF